MQNQLGDSSAIRLNYMEAVGMLARAATYLFNSICGLHRHSRLLYHNFVRCRDHGYHAGCFLPVSEVSCLASPHA